MDARIEPEEGDLDVTFFDACIAARKVRTVRSVMKKEASLPR